MNVYPRQPLRAELDNDPHHPLWWFFIPLRPGDEAGYYEEAEFAAAFVPAERLDALIEAAREVWTPCDVRELNGPRRGWCSAHNEYLRSYGCSMDVLGVALRAYDERQEQ